MLPSAAIPKYRSVKLAFLLSGRFASSLFNRSLGAMTLIAVLSLLAACKDPPPPTNGEVEGAILGKLLSGQISNSLTHVVSFRCARPDLNAISKPKAISQSRIENGVLYFDFEEDNRTFLIAFVADSRGAAPQTLQNVAYLRTQFASENVNVVVSLGGIAEQQSEIESVLSSLTENSDFILVALPGDRESVPAHRSAVEALAQKGRRIVDGSQYPLIGIGDLILANLPGIGYQSNLIPGEQGCIHTKEDIQKLRASIQAQQKQVVLASYVPIMDTTHNLGAGSIPIGDPQTVSLSKAPGIWAAVHGMIGAADTPIQGPTHGKIISLGPQGRVVSVASGAMDSAGGNSSALLMSISAKTINWRRLIIPSAL